MFEPISNREKALLLGVGFVGMVAMGAWFGAASISLDTWSALSAIGTVLGAFFSAVGSGIAAWIAWKSFQASRLSAELAKAALDHQLIQHRQQVATMESILPQVEMTASVNSDNSVNECRIEAYIVWKNVGQRTASSVSIKLKLYMSDGGENQAYYAADTVPRAVAPGEEVASEKIVIEGADAASFFSNTSILISRCYFMDAGLEIGSPYSHAKFEIDFGATSPGTPHAVTPVTISRSALW